MLESFAAGSGVHSLTLDIGGAAADAAPGRFVHVACGDGLLLRRPISICDAIGSAIRLVFEIKGQGTKRMAAARPGDSLDVLGPLGHGYQPAPGVKVLLCGGGLGAAPLLLAARTWSCDAVLGFQTAKKVILAGEFAEACGSVGIATDDGSLGHGGFVTELLEQRLKNEKYFVLACGPEPMLRAVAPVCAKYGAPLQVSLERRMGCGVGACLVCAVKKKDGGYARACKDGPVFDIGEVDLNG